jgi:REP element-mobilizing transposase RayT
MAKPQLAFDLSDRGRHGGRRTGSARKPNRKKGLPTHVPHRARPRIDRHTPLHVTLRVDAAVGWLRRLDTYRAVRAAMQNVQARLDTFRVCHVSIQSNHIHLIIEADDQTSLSRGMTSLLVSAARRINRLRCRRGRVFADRYHLVPLPTPTQVRNALNYVVNNWRHHGHDRGAHHALDPFATGRTFDGFAEHRIALPWPDEAPLPIAFPTSRLLGELWKHEGLLSVRAVPG